jgi:hypothetical protein
MTEVDGLLVTVKQDSLAALTYYLAVLGGSMPSTRSIGTA